MKSKCLSIVVFAVAAVVASLALSAEPKLELAEIFSDGAVVQRDRPAVVWGWAAPGARIQAEFGGTKASAVADAQGRWRLELGSFMASEEPWRLSVTDDRGGRVERNDIVVGEVWHCSGQSNMEHPVWSDLDWYRAANGGLVAQLANFDKIRCYRACGGWNKRPQERTHGKWRKFVADGKPFNVFSALAMNFAVQLRQSLGCPIGIIDTSRGGASIDSYIPAEGWGMLPELQKINAKLGKVRAHEDVSKEALALWKSRGQEDNRRRQATVLYNGVVHPLRLYSVRGFLWYQGETNMGDPLYKAKMHALYRSWSQANGGKDMPFYFAQLGPHERRRVYDCSNAYIDNAQCGPELSPTAAWESFCAFWDAQRGFAKEEKNAWMVVINDIADITDAHIRDKQSIALRFAAFALEHTYGFKIHADYAEAVSAERTVNGEIVVKVKNAAKLFSYHPREIRTVEVSGADGKFVLASAKVRGASLVVTCPGVEEPRRVRFLHTPLAECNIQNEYGQPLDAFDLAVGGVARVVAGTGWGDGKTDRFDGEFVRHHFKVAGRNCWVVAPKKVAEGKPWVWATTFPTVFYERGPVPALLRAGYHYAYMDTGDSWGSPAALEWMRQFYLYVTDRGLARKAVLTGLSRGGSYIHRYAAEHPEHVAVIYGDHPVCDLKSCPMHFDRGDTDDYRKSNGMCRNLMSAYGFKSYDEVKTFDGNPVDGKIVAKLRAARIPIIHVAADLDQSVPCAANTDVFERKYKVIGGEITVFRKHPDASVPDGEEIKVDDFNYKVNPARCGHHPHGLKDPSPVVALIRRCTEPQVAAPKPSAAMLKRLAE